MKICGINQRWTDNLYLGWAITTGAVYSEVYAEWYISFSIKTWVFLLYSLHFSGLRATTKEHTARITWICGTYLKRGMGDGSGRGVVVGVGVLLWGGGGGGGGGGVIRTHRARETDRHGHEYGHGHGQKEKVFALKPTYLDENMF